jgi:hypothetical protein
MLSPAAVEETNLLELRAEGSDPMLLQLTVNAWAKAYEDLRRNEIAQLKTATMAELESEQAALLVTIDERQLALAQFRERHDIVSLEAADNRAPAKLKGLNQSLNKAQERLVNAEAERAAIMEAVAQGKTVVPTDQRAELSAKQLEAQKIREQLASLERKYTKNYIEIDPALRALPGRLAELEDEIAAMRLLGQSQVIEDVDREVQAAKVAAHALEAQLRAHQRDAQAFTTLYNEYEAQQAELARLRDLSAANVERLAQIEARNLEKYPPVQIVDWAGLPSQPIFPHYRRDTGIVLGAALFSALFITWLVDYLSGHERQGQRVYSGIRVYPNDEDSQNAIDAKREVLAIDGQGTARLDAPPPPKEIEQSELWALLQAADPLTAGWVVLLLSGVAPEELLSLHDDSFDLDSGRVLVPGDDARAIALGSGARQRLATCRNHIGKFPSALDLDTVNAQLEVAAVDAGLSEPFCVTAYNLWRTYVLFLVRQGARLADLPQQVGTLPHSALRELVKYSPPSVNRPLNEIETILPLLERQES